MTPQTSLTQQLAGFVANLRYDDLPAEVVAQAKRVIMDAVGCVYGAYGMEPEKVGMIAALAAQFPPNGPAHVIGGARAQAAFAAFCNGFLTNATDNDDTHKRALIHVGSVVVPAALAMVQDRGGSGRDLITAVVAGYEVTARIGMAVMPTHYRFWHSTATNGTFGAAAAAGSAIGLSADEMRHALGYAGTQAAGLNTFFESGDEAKHVNPGKAAMNGVLAAIFAQSGLTACPDIIGHPKGYLAAYTLDPKPERITTGLGERWEILENGFKFYPSILASHSPIGAALEIAGARALSAGEIESIRVETYSTVKSHFSNLDVQTPMSARLSVPYCAMIALLDGEVSNDQFSAARIADPDAQALLKRCEVVADDALTALYPEKFPARVIVTLTSGETLTALHHYPKGDPNNPLSEAELTGKFMANMAHAVSEEAAEAVFDAIRTLDSAEQIDIFPTVTKRQGGAR